MFSILIFRLFSAILVIAFSILLLSRLFLFLARFMFQHYPPPDLYLETEAGVLSTLSSKSFHIFSFLEKWNDLIHFSFDFLFFMLFDIVLVWFHALLPGFPEFFFFYLSLIFFIFLKHSDLFYWKNSKIIDVCFQSIKTYSYIEKDICF